ncbi:MAG: YhdH/YhfP family quinone oxidoreductase [Bacteroidota bacterium]
MNSYRALVVRKTKEGSQRTVETLDSDFLPDHPVRIRVHYSSLNYKDALSAEAHSGVTRTFPHTPGIDAAGVVERSKDDRFAQGDKVIVTSYDLGMNTPGGFGQYISVPGDWVIPLPEGMDLRTAMCWGTAGLTAGIAVHRLMNNDLQPDGKRALVTGATGGVGSLAIVLLRKAGYEPVAATGKADAHDYLTELGAVKIMDRRELAIPEEEKRPLLKSRWDAAVDTVGGDMLDTVIRQVKHNGAVSSCGNVRSNELHTNVLPFILRGVSLLGIDSGICLMDLRTTIWNKLADEWSLDQQLWDQIIREVALDDLNQEIDHILEGGQRGRVIVRVQ